MRDYIFRGKRVDTGELVEGCLIHQGDHYLILQDESKLHPMDVPYINELGCIDGYATPVVPDSVGQYTGMKDKNGRKIFEGDIINIEYDTTTVENCVVTYIGACFYGNTDFDSWELDYYVDIEVIGNVFENADLLEG